MMEERLIQELKRTKEQVEYLLERYENTRNNDFYLQLLWLKIFGGVKNMPWINWEQIKKLSGKLQTVARVRRKIQNEEGKYLPTDPEVLARRQRRERAYRKIIKRFGRT